MDIEITLDRAEMRRAVVEYLQRKGYNLSDQDVTFVVTKGYDYYDNPTGPELTAIKAQVTIEGDKEDGII